MQHAHFNKIYINEKGMKVLTLDIAHDSKCNEYIICLDYSTKKIIAIEVFEFFNGTNKYILFKEEEVNINKGDLSGIVVTTLCNKNKFKIKKRNMLGSDYVLSKVAV